MNIKELILRIGELVNYSIGLVIGIALLVFLWGLARFMFKTGDPKEIDSGKKLMTWGIIALFVMVSVWGIVAFVQSAFGLPRGPILPPCFTISCLMG